MTSRFRPGRQTQIENRIRWNPITTKVTSINAGSKKLAEATPGGLLGIATKLDPALTKSDALAGQVAGHERLPPVWDKFKFQVTLMERVVGSRSELVIEPLKHQRTADALCRNRSNRRSGNEHEKRYC